jgi:hypothetical protein
MNSPFLFHATNGRLGKYLLGRSSHPLSGQDPRAQADDGAHQRSASEGRNKRRRRGMKKSSIKVARQHSWLETGTLPSPCIPARKQRPGRAKGAAKEVTRAGRRPLKVNRKRINAAVWHDSPQGRSRGPEDGLFNLSTARDKAPGLSESCPCRNREGPCLFGFPRCADEMAAKRQSHDLTRRPTCNHHRQTGNLMCFSRLRSRARPYPQGGEGGTGTEWRPSCCDLE